MRQFTDSNGHAWDAEVGRESYGMQVILFFPAGGGGVRKAMLAADTRLEAHRELDGLSDDELREALRRSVPWEADGGLSV